LVAAVRAGHPNVTSELCDRLWPQVTQTIARLLDRFDSDQEDLAQISLIEIVRTIGNYRGDCPLDLWAQTIAAHAVFKHLRRWDLVVFFPNCVPTMITRVPFTSSVFFRHGNYSVESARTWIK
jgi:DNA-directed RNA polymerase specialized sigma24 family protein